MGGGLIQIASYGLHDKYLTNNPEITFFKMVYKRYTNFTMEFNEEMFNGDLNFGSTMNCVIPKIGDLLHKIYLKIDLPIVNINKLDYGIKDNNSDNYILLNENYIKLQKFYNIINYNIIQPLYTLLELETILFNDINNKYIILFNKINYNNIINNINNINIKFNKNFILLLFTDNNIIYENTYVNISEILDFNNYYNKYIKDNSNINYNILLKFLLDNYIKQLHIIKKKYYEMMLEQKKINDIKNRNNINFAWVEYIGHQIINKLEIIIGGKVIDITDNINLHIKYQLSSNHFLLPTYNKLIGNVPELTTFDSKIKPEYSLYIPLDFWFSKYTGLSLPLIFLRYHDVSINLKLNYLTECCYFEKLNNNIVIEDLIKITSISLLLNYVYLDKEERIKFGQYKHEYLIDQTQMMKYSINKLKNINIELPFFNPIKQIFWFVRYKNNIDKLKYFEFSNINYIDIYEFSSFNFNTLQINTVNSNISNYINIGDIIIISNSIYYSGEFYVKNIINEFIYITYTIFPIENYKFNYNPNYTKSDNYILNCQAFLYKKTIDNPISSSLLELNGVIRFNFTDNIYTNYVQPYQHNSRIPNNGIHSYSFSLNPELHQPSGFCNFNKINYKVLSLTFNNILDDFDVFIYVTNYNILKFEYGKASLFLNI